MHNSSITRALHLAENFTRHGVLQLATSDRPDSQYLVSAAPVPTALAILALSIPNIYSPANIQQGVNYLTATQLTDGGWGNIPTGPFHPLATTICSKGMQAAENCWNLQDLIYDTAYLVAKTWTQDFERLAPDWLPKQNSPLLKLIEAISGKPLVPTLDTITLADLSVISRFMPPYGRPTILAVTLIKAHYRYGITPELKEAANSLAAQQSGDGSWCEDIMVTSLATMALYLTGCYKPLAKAAEWLCKIQYPNGGWPSFNQLTNWALGWGGYLLGTQDHSLRQASSTYLIKALNADSSLGTAPPYSYPDLDDTAIGLLALAKDPAVPKELLSPIHNLLLRLQNNDGSWSTFPSLEGLPPGCHCKFPVYIKSEDVTVHVLLSLIASGITTDSPTVNKAVSWLIKRQRPDGTWNSTWFLGQTYATAQVLDLLLDLSPDSPAIAKGIAALIHNQNSRGAWHTGSAGETGLALYALLRAGVTTDHSAITRGVNYLLSLQQADGSFQPFYSGFYASGLYYEEPLSEALAAVRGLRYYMQRLSFRGESEES